MTVFPQRETSSKGQILGGLMDERLGVSSMATAHAEFKMDFVVEFKNSTWGALENIKEKSATTRDWTQFSTESQLSGALT